MLLTNLFCFFAAFLYLHFLTGIYHPVMIIKKDTVKTRDFITADTKPDKHTYMHIWQMPREPLRQNGEYYDQHNKLRT